MSATESRPTVHEAASKVLADYTQDNDPSDIAAGQHATVLDVIEGRRPAHELPPELHDLYRTGFRDGCNRMQKTVYGLTRECNHWYWVANNPAEARAERDSLLKSFDVALARESAAEQWAELDRIAAERAEAARG